MTSLPTLTFVDTNVLLYAHDGKQGARHQQARALLGQLWRSRAGVLSTQVLHEFYANATKTYKIAMARSDARRVVAWYAQWRVIPIDAELILSASRLEESHSVSFWDALIVEAALRAGATYLVSEDLQDGRRFETLTVRNPFR